MNTPDDLDLESSLRALRWRQPPAPVFQQALEAALTEQRRASSAPTASEKRKRAMLPVRLLTSIPRGIRWPLAACWLLSLFFKLNTPDPVPATLRDTLAKLPEVDAALLVARLDEQHRLLARLIDDLHRRTNDPSESLSPLRSPLP